jgi:hypothetical protein
MNEARQVGISPGCYGSVVAEPPEPPQGPQVFISPDQVGGVWANFAAVNHSPFEFTLDFVRLDYGRNPPEGVVVARVNMSPLFVSQLIDALQTNWKMFAEKAMPKEVTGGGDSDSHGAE